MKPWKVMPAKLKNPAFSCRLVTAINQVYQVYPRFVQVVSCQGF